MIIYAALLEYPRGLSLSSSFVHHALRIPHLSPFADLSTQQSAPDSCFHHRISTSRRQSLGFVPHDC